jgi:hypothetical protein
MTEKQVWIGYHHDVGTSAPMIAFDSLETAEKWKKLNADRKIKMLFINEHANCPTCGKEQ